MLENFQFQLRQHVLGRMVLRPGLPRLQARAADVNECAYYCKLFCAAMDKRTRRAVAQVIDVGCRNWSYAQALADSFPRATLLGVELDGYRRYWNMYRRIDYAQAYAAQLGRPARAVAGDFCALSALDRSKIRGDTLFCFVFPFVTENPCLRWGLPSRYANYQALLQHAIQLAAPGRPRFLAVHQGDWEVEAAGEIYAALGFDMHAVKLSPRDWAGLWPSPHDNWVCFGGPSPLGETLGRYGLLTASGANRP